MEEKRDLIGQILIAKFGLTEWPIVFALNKQAKEKMRLCSLLLRERAVTEEVLARALSVQLGVNAIVISKSAFLLSALTTVPEEIAHRETVLPMQVIGNIVVLACADPHKKEVFAEIERKSGKIVAPHVCVESALKTALDRAYHVRGLSAGGLFSGASNYTIPGSDTHLEVIADAAGLTLGEAPRPKDEIAVVSTAEDIENITSGRGIGGVKTAPARAVPVETPPEEIKPPPPAASAAAGIVARKPPADLKAKLPRHVGDDGVDHDRPTEKPWIGELPGWAIAVLLAGILGGAGWAGYKLLFTAAQETGPQAVMPVAAQLEAFGGGVQPGSGAIKGKVLDAAGGPMKGTVVRVVSAPNIPPTPVDDKGAFSFKGLVPGMHHLQAIIPEDLRGKGLNTIVPLVMVNVEKVGETPVIIGGSEGKGIIEGYVVRKKKPVAGADVTLFLFLAEGKSEELITLKTGEEGEFNILSAGPGKYLLDVRTKEGERSRREIGVTPGSRWRQEIALDGTGKAAAGVEVPVSSSKTDDSGPALGSMRGTVVDGDGRGVGGVQVRAVPSGRVKSDDDTLGATTDSSGAFSIEGLIPGTYSVEARTGEGSPAMQGGIRVKVGAPAKVRLVVGAGVNLTLRLLDLKGRIMSGGHLAVKREGGGEPEYDGQGDFEGTNTLNGIAPGRYRVQYQGLSTLDKKVTWTITVGKQREQTMDLSTTTANKE